ncbi:S8 family serine peptidase [Paenibacillus sp. OSY-SE]|uniref:S8 family serine peptidase n=1 Tax=Paenibacillus sp. OSY-SE TaxID=1196323 RepID=UPI0002E3D8C8|nr:S8 family serine peptidase [Paenibacillus sp. OSY-SE]
MSTSSWRHRMIAVTCAFAMAACLFAPFFHAGTASAAGGSQGKIAKAEQPDKQGNGSSPTSSSIPYTGKGVKVAIIDSGADVNHPLLKDRISGAYDFVENDANPQDEKGHGTHVAGIVAQQASGASLLVYRAIGSKIHDNTTPVVAALKQAVKDGAKVINLSMRADINAPGEPLSIAIADAVKQGIVVVTSAGNDGTESWNITAPGGMDEIITVGAATLTQEMPLLQHEDRMVRLIPAKDVRAFPNNGTVEPTFLNKVTAEQLAKQSHKGKLLVVNAGEEWPSDWYEAAVKSGASGLLLYKDGKQEWELELGITGGDESKSIPAASLSAQGVEQLRTSGQADWNWKSEKRARVSDMSSRGPAIGTWLMKPDLVAPGIDIRSSLPLDLKDEGYGRMSGTSMASPQVAAAAAILIEAHPDWTPAMIKSALVAHAESLIDVNGNPYPRSAQGAGLLNLEQALNTDVFVQPAALSFGLMTEADQNKTSREQSFTITNRSEETQTYEIKAERENMTSELSMEFPSSVTARAGETVSVPVKWNVGGLQENGLLTGLLLLTSGTGQIEIPFQLIAGANDYPLVTGLFADGQLLTPNGDFSKAIQFHYYITVPSDRVVMTAERIDDTEKARGRQYIIKNEKQHAAGLFDMSWGGMDVVGNKVPDGLYNIKVKSFVEQRQGMDDDQIILIDRKAPQAVVDQKKAAKGVLNGKLQDLMLALDYAARPMLGEAGYDESKPLVTVQWSLSNQGEWKPVHVNEENKAFYVSLDKAGLKKGKHTVWLRLADAAGNTQNQVITVIIK